MKIRFLLNEEHGLPHIYKQNVDEDEVRDILCDPIQDREARENARSATGQTRNGRYLRVIYTHDSEPNSVFCHHCI